MKISMLQRASSLPLNPKFKVVGSDGLGSRLIRLAGVSVWLNGVLRICFLTPPDPAGR